MQEDSAYRLLKRRYVPKFLYVPKDQAQLYLEIKMAAARLQKSIWEYFYWLHKRYSKEGESDKW